MRDLQAELDSLCARGSGPVFQNAYAQRSPFEQLHHRIGHPLAVAPEVVNGEDVRM